MSSPSVLDNSPEVYTFSRVGGWSGLLTGRRVSGRFSVAALQPGPVDGAVTVFRSRPGGAAARNDGYAFSPAEESPPPLTVGWSTGWAARRVALRGRLGRTPRGWTPTLAIPRQGGRTGPLGWRFRGRGRRLPPGWGGPVTSPLMAANRVPRRRRVTLATGWVGRRRLTPAVLVYPRGWTPGLKRRRPSRLVRYVRWRRLSRSYRATRPRWWRRRRGAHPKRGAARRAALLRRRLTPRLRRYQAGFETLPELARLRYRRSIVKAGGRHTRGARQYTALPRPVRGVPTWGRPRRVVGAPRLRPVGQFRRRHRRRRGGRPRPTAGFVGLLRRPRAGPAPTPHGWAVQRGSAHWATPGPVRRRRYQPLPRRGRPYRLVPAARLRVGYRAGPFGRAARRLRWGRSPRKSPLVWVNFQGRVLRYTRGYAPPRYFRTPGRTYRWSDRRVRRWRWWRSPRGLHRRRWLNRRATNRVHNETRAYYAANLHPSPAEWSRELAPFQVRDGYARLFRNRGRRWRLNQTGGMFPTWRLRRERPRVRRPARLVRGGPRPGRRARRRMRRRQLRFRRPYRRRNRRSSSGRPLPRRRRHRRWRRRSLRQRRRNRRLHPGRLARARRRRAARHRRRELERLAFRRVTQRRFRWRAARVTTRRRWRRPRPFQAARPVTEASVLQTQVVRLLSGFQRHGVAGPVDRVTRLVRRRFHRRGHRVGHLFYRLFTTVDVRVVRRGGVATQLPCVGRPDRVVRLIRRWLRLGVARHGWTPEWTTRVTAGLTNLGAAESARLQHNTTAMANLAYL